MYAQVVTSPGLILGEPLNSHPRCCKFIPLTPWNIRQSLSLTSFVKDLIFKRTTVLLTIIPDSNNIDQRIKLD